MINTGEIINQQSIMQLTQTILLMIYFVKNLCDICDIS